MVRATTYQNVLWYLLIVGGIFIILYPILWMISSSFKPTDEIFTHIGLWPRSFTLDHYINGWAGIARTTFTTFFLNSFIMVGFAIVGNVLSCSLAAYAFGRLAFKGRAVMFALMLLTMMIPHHVLVVPQYIMFNELDWLNSLLPITVPKYFATEAFFIFLMVQFIRSLPRELDQAATVDGCGPIRIYTRIIVPLLTPALVTTVIFTFIWTWNDFFSQLLYLSSADKFTVTLALRMFVDALGESSLGSLFAMSVLSVAPVFLMFLFFQRYIVEGIASTGIK